MSEPMFQKCLVLIFLILCPKIAVSDQGYGAETPVLDEEYSAVVTAKRRLEPEWQATRMIQKIDADSIVESGATSLPDVLDESVGVFVQRTNRGAGAPIIRGLVGPQNLIVIDGIPFNTSTFRTGPNQYLQLFDSQAVGSLEVLRGPSSVLYGSGAMGGVIQIRSHALDTLHEPGGRTSLRIRTADMGAATSSDLWYIAQDWRISAGISYDLLGQLRAGGGFIEPHSGHHKLYWRSKAEAEIGGFDVQASYFGAIIDDAGRTDKLGLGDLRFYDNVDHFSYLRLSYEDSGVLEKMMFSLSHHRLSEEVLRYNCSQATNEDGQSVVSDLNQCISLVESILTSKRRYNDRVDTLGASLLFWFEPWTSRLNLLAGAEVYQDFVASRAAAGVPGDGFEMIAESRGNFSDDSRYRSLSGFLHGEMVLRRSGELVLSANGGTRFAHFSAFAPNLPELGDVHYNHSAPVFSGGIQALWSDWLNLYGVFAQGFRAPNLQETTVLGDTGSKFEIPNSELGPESSNTYELGMKLRTARIEVDLVAFYAKLDNVIDEVSALYQGAEEVDGTPVIQRVNQSQGLTRGVEGNFRLKFSVLAFFGGMAWMEGEITDAAGQTHPMRRIPPLFGHMGLRYQPRKSAYLELGGRWALAQDALHPGDLKDQRICQTEPYSGVLKSNCSGTPAWFSLNLDAGISLNEELSFNLSAHNLLDMRYRTHGSGFFAPGLDIRLSARVRY